MMKKVLQSLILLLGALMLPASAYAQQTLHGDMNGDGEINIADINAVINIILGGPTNPSADVNNDGEVNIADINALIDIILGGSAPNPSEIETITVNGTSFNMVKVEGGTFMMGATDEQISEVAHYNEYPAHQVSLSSYCIGQTEVTQALWQAVMGNNPSSFTCDLNNPVEQVSWNDCQEFISKLNQMTGKTFRLPTEAEWEYAARGGNKSKGYKYAGSNDIDEVAWYSDNNGVHTNLVATKAPNELGLYDMSGNVYEWCQDWFGYYSSEAQTNPTGPSSGNYRIFRGGGWNQSARDCRVSHRYYNIPDGFWYNVGLRLVLVDEHEYVDLGLPSGTLWATRNVGASSPEDYGDYFAWGETAPKDYYDLDTYKWYQGYSDADGYYHGGYTKYCTNSYYGLDGFVDNKTELDPSDDAACAHYPGGRMPSQEQIQELIDNCTYQWTQQNGVNGGLSPARMEIPCSCPLRATAGTSRSTALASSATIGRARSTPATRASLTTSTSTRAIGATGITATAATATLCVPCASRRISTLAHTKEHPTANSRRDASVTII